MADGTTVEQGIVYFMSDTAEYTARIQPNGTFSPGVLKDGAGIPPGTYKIKVGGVDRMVDPPGGANPEKGLYPMPVSIIDAKYASTDTSGFTLDTSKTKTLDIVFEPAKNTDFPSDSRR